MDQQTLMLAGGVTAVVGIAVTAMWAVENVSFGTPKEKTEKRERGRKGDGKKKKGDKKTQDMPAQRAAAVPHAPPPAPKPVAPPVQPAAPAPAKEEGKKKGKKGGKGSQVEAEAAQAKEAKAAAAPAAAPAAKGKKGKQAAAPVQLPGEPKDGQKKAAKEKKKKDKAAAQQADVEDGWCQVGKGGKAKGDGMMKLKGDDSVAASDPYMGVTDTSAVFFQVPVGAGGDFLEAYAMRKQASVAPSTSGGTNDLQTDPGASKKSKNKKSTTPDLHASSNGWSPATDEVASTVARDLASMTIAPSPVKKAAPEEEEWATVPVKSKKKSSKT